MRCPRRGENPVASRAFPGEDLFSPSDDSCSYCGSLNPEVFMARLEAGDVEVIPTDKNYKVYLLNKNGASFKQTYRDCPPGVQDSYDQCSHWVTREITEHKFYFVHLSEEQQNRFVALFDGGKLKLGYPGNFYVKPFFLELARDRNKPVIPESQAPPVDRSATCLTDGSPVTADHRELKANGQQKGYVVLTPEERAKGFVRPVRRSYVHIGKPPKGEQVVYPYSKTFPGGCGSRTQMSLSIAETYARDPKFYGGTFCVGCGEHFPLDQFVWEGTTEQVGS